MTHHPCLAQERDSTRCERRPSWSLRLCGALARVDEVGTHQQSYDNDDDDNLVHIIDYTKFTGYFCALETGTHEQVRAGRLPRLQRSSSRIY